MIFFDDRGYPVRPMIGERWRDLVRMVFFVKHNICTFRREWTTSGAGKNLYREV